MQVNGFSVPGVILDRNPEFVELYQAAWKMAAEHIQDLPGLPVVRHMDEACDPSRLWIWDTCFMVHFCKYAPKTILLATRMDQPGRYELLDYSRNRIVVQALPEQVETSGAAETSTGTSDQNGEHN